jgi:transcriptional regulator GlxA family with amidase domain
MKLAIWTTGTPMHMQQRKAASASTATTAVWDIIVAASWSVDTLAKEVGLSRIAFIDRFAQLIGMPPIRYLTVWRLEIAKRHLRESRMSIPQIAVAVGYESEEGFRRAFKREFEIWPAEWRHH